MSSLIKRRKLKVKGLLLSNDQKKILYRKKTGLGPFGSEKSGACSTSRKAARNSCFMFTVSGFNNLD
jgi:hypothetical protein